jgi:hypothetical protein
LYRSKRGAFATEAFHCAMLLRAHLLLSPPTHESGFKSRDDAS